ncbi:MAG: cell division protein FtsL [Treponema sp.]|nr:cell division protein FtsL [Treponema sp.]
MIRRCVLLYFMVLTIPLFLGISAWQSIRYSDLEKETRTLEAAQEKWVEDNRLLIADIATLTSSENVENIAVHDLKLQKIQPENVLQVWIEGK